MWVDDGVGGFVVPVRDPSALAEKLVYLIQSPEERRRFGLHNRRIIEKPRYSQFAVQDQARQFLKDNRDTMVKVETEVRKNLGLPPVGPQPTAQAQSAAQGAGQTARVTTMPTGTEGKPPVRR